MKVKPVLSMVLCYAIGVAAACSGEKQQELGAAEIIEKSEAAKNREEISQPEQEPSVQEQEPSVQKHKSSVREQEPVTEGIGEETTSQPATGSTREPKPAAEGEKASAKPVTRSPREQKPVVTGKGEKGPSKTAARSPQADKSVFRVISTNPAKGASGVSPDLMRIKVTFSHDVDVDSLYDTRINGNRIGGTSGTGKTISITARRPPGAGKTCSVTIPPDAASVDGKRLGKAYSFEFTTASDSAD